MAYLHSGCPAAVISQQATHNTLPECGPSVPGPNEGNKKRLLVGWRHQDDESPRLKEGRMWCWVTSAGHFFVYDESYNRSPVAGQVRFCGVANFTMVRMFHPWFAMPGLGVPKDMDFAHKKWCRKRYWDAIRRYEAQQSATGGPGEHPGNDADGDDSDGAESGTGTREINTLLVNSPAIEIGSDHDGSVRVGSERIGCNDDPEDSTGNSERSRKSSHRGGKRARGNRARSGHQRSGIPRRRRPSSRGRGRANGRAMQRPGSGRARRGRDTRSSPLSIQTTIDSSDEEFQIFRARNDDTNSRSPLAARTNNMLRKFSVATNSEKDLDVKDEDTLELELAKMIHAANHRHSSPIESLERQDFRYTSRAGSDEANIFISDSDNEFRKRVAEISRAQSQKSGTSARIKREDPVGLDLMKKEPEDLREKLCLSGFTADNPVSLD